MEWFKNIGSKLHPWRLKHLTQQHFLLLLSVVVGLLSGLVAVLIKNAVSFIREILTGGFVTDYFNWFYVFYPLLGLLLTAYVIHRVIKKNPGPGIPTTLHAISQRKGRLRRHQIYSSLFTSIFTVGFGGSAGLEAPTVQTAAAISSNLGAEFKLNYKTKILLIGCAAAGSMAAIFKAPIAAIVFAIEIFMIEMTTASMVPLLLASISAVLTNSLIQGDERLLNFQLVDPFTFSELPFFILFGILAGVSSAYFNRIYLWITGVCARIKSVWKRAVTGGILVGIIVLIFPALYGEGYEIINALLADNLLSVAQNSIFYQYTDNRYMMLLFMGCLVFFKVVATALTLGSGGIGGIFAPTLFMGSTLGFLFTRIFRYFDLASLSASNFALVGMAGLMSGVLHAPLTAVFLIAEITGGYELFVPLMLVAALAYYTAKLFNPHTIYTKELAERGELITHNRDQAAMALMQLDGLVEKDYPILLANQRLAALISAIPQSEKTTYVICKSSKEFVGFIDITSVRHLLFDKEQHYALDELAVFPEVVLFPSDTIAQVLEKFDHAGRGLLPVLEDGKYMGAIRKSQLLHEYREQLVSLSEDLV